MNNDVEELLTEGMQRTTAGVRMAPELAGRLSGQAASKHRRRLFTQAGVAGGTALAVAAGFVIAGVLSPATSGTAEPQVQTAAYVVSQMNHALGRAPWWPTSSRRSRPAASGRRPPAGSTRNRPIL
jgi:hypothetical protein